MKLCPKCRSSYADDTLKFCLQDGTPLTDRPPSETESPTVGFGQKTPESYSEEITEQLAGLPATQKYTTEKDLPTGPDLPPPSSGPDNWGPSQETIIARTGTPAAAPSNRSNTLLAVLATALVMILLFGAAGIGAWFYFRPENSEIAENNDNRKPTIPEKNVNSGRETTPAPTVSPAATKNPASSPDQTPVSNFDPEDVKREVSDQIYSWKSQAESRNLNGYMNYYADTIHYYRKKGASRSFVRSDKQKAFSKYDVIEITISNLTIAPAADGRSATAEFDKQWYFAGGGKTSEGKVRSQLKLENSGGRWQITGERDQKVYFVN